MTKNADLYGTSVTPAPMDHAKVIEKSLSYDASRPLCTTIIGAPRFSYTTLTNELVTMVPSHHIDWVQQYSQYFGEWLNIF